MSTTVHISHNPAVMRVVRDVYIHTGLILMMERQYNIMHFIMVVINDAHVASVSTLSQALSS